MKQSKDSGIVYLFIVMLTALLSASNANKLHIISSVAPPNFCWQLINQNSAEGNAIISTQETLADIHTLQNL